MSGISEEYLDQMEKEICWYPFGLCNNKPEKITKKPIGSDPMQYCKKHATEMRKRHAWEKQNLSKSDYLEYWKNPTHWYPQPEKTGE